VRQTVRTAISIQKSLYEKADAFAKEMKIPRSKLFSLALEAFLEKKESEKLLAEINAACSPEGDDEKKLRKAHKKRHSKAISEESW